MVFNIKFVRVKVSFTFLCLFLLIIPNGNYNVFLCSFFASLIHEFVHLFLILLFRGEVKEITFSLLGGNIKRSHNIILQNYKEILISLSAPVFNIFLGVVFICLGIYEHFAWINIIIGIFNLLPFYSFDGGRALKYFLYNKVNQKTSDSLLFFVSLFISVIFIVLSLHFFLNYKNHFILLMSIFMLLSVIFNIKDI